MIQGKKAYRTAGYAHIYMQRRNLLSDKIRQLL